MKHRAQILTVSLVIPNHCDKYKSLDKSETLKMKQITNLKLKQFLMIDIGSLKCPCLYWSPCFSVDWMISCPCFGFGLVLGYIGWASFGGCWGWGCGGSWGISGLAVVFVWNSAAARVSLLFFGTFLLVLTNFSFWLGECALKSFGNLWGNSNIPCL